MIALFEVCPTARTGMAVGVGNKNPGVPTQSQLNGCLGTSPGPIAATYNAGSTISVTWETTIYHASAPGVSIAVSYDGNTFTSLASGLDIGQNGFHNTTVKLPAGQTSNNAIIQWIWQSTADGGFYLGCSDVSIVASGAAPTPACDTANFNPKSTGKSAANTQTILIGTILVNLIAALLFL